MNCMNQRSQSWLRRLVRVFLAVTLSMVVVLPSLADDGNGGVITDNGTDGDYYRRTVIPGPVVPPHMPTQPQHPANGLRGLQAVDTSLQGIRCGPSASLDMKLLVIAADGSETDYRAVTAFLQRLGIPYDSLIATQTTLSSSLLWKDSHGYYQGIILTTGNLTYYNSQSGRWESAFSADEWMTLWQYESMFCVRQLTSYTYPAGAPDNYGLNYVTYQDTTATPLQGWLTPEGQTIYPYLNAASPIRITNAWVYLGTVVNPAVTTPLIVTREGYAVAAITRYADGRENLAVTAANNPYLLHSLLLSYGNINWVTKGLFLGERHVYLSPQVDDLLQANAIWDPVARSDRTGLTYRISSDDFNAALTWQTGIRTRYNVAGDLTLEWAFNGEGAIRFNPDPLTLTILRKQSEFRFVNHTYSHPNLDDVTYREALIELVLNNAVARNLFHFGRYSLDALVQPEASGLNNPNFLRAAKDAGIKYLISDTSRPGWNNPSHNAGFYSIYQPGILIIPRRPTNLFYNVTTPQEWVSEYNCYYGPAGTCAGGRWHYWDHDLTYHEILDKESDMLLLYLLTWDVDPLMFHQANMRAYDGVHSLLGDLIATALAKYSAVSSLRIRSLSQHDIGIKMAQRMAYNAAEVTATLRPCTSVTLSATRPAVVPVTGLDSGQNTESYGGQTISYVALNAGESRTFAVTCSR